MTSFSESSETLFPSGLKFWDNQLVGYSPNFFWAPEINFGLSPRQWFHSNILQNGKLLRCLMTSFSQSSDGLFSIWLKLWINQLVGYSPKFLWIPKIIFGLFTRLKTRYSDHSAFRSGFNISTVEDIGSTKHFVFCDPECFPIDLLSKEITR